MSTLRLFLTESSLPPDSDAEVEWRLLDGPVAGKGRSTLARLPAAQRIDVFLPPSAVFRTAVTLPPGGRRQARRLLAHALDTVLLGDPDEQHLAFAMTGDRCRVATIEQRRLQAVVSRLAAAGRRVNAIYAADVLIPADGSTALWYGNGWARRLAEEALWFDADLPAVCPPLLAGSLKSVDTLTLATADHDIDLDAWQAACGVPVSLGHADPFNAPLAADAINLLQGDFAAGPQFDIDWTRFKPTLQLGGALIALAALGWVGQWSSWRGEEKALKRSMDDAFVAAFPGTPVVDAQLQLQAKLKGGATPAANDVLGQLVSLAPLFAVSGDAKLIGLEYADGHLNADYRAKPEQLAQIAQNLAQRGQLQTAAVAADRVRLSLTPRP